MDEYLKISEKNIISKSIKLKRACYFLTASRTYDFGTTVGHDKKLTKLLSLQLPIDCTGVIG